MIEKRKHQRIARRLPVVVRNLSADHKTVTGEFVSTDMSPGGIFISSGDLSLFDPGEEVMARVEDPVDYREGRARVVRSVRVFKPDAANSPSGFALAFDE